MNGHNADDVRILIERVGLSEIHLLRLHLIHIAEELKQAGVRRLLKIPRNAEQHAQIGRALSAGGQRRDVILIPCVDHQSGEKLMNRKYRAECAVPVNLLQKPAAFLRERRIAPVRILVIFPVSLPAFAVGHQHRHPRILADCRIKLRAALLVFCPDEGEFLLVKAAEIAPHRAIQRNVLTGIVQHAQILDYLADLLCLKISGPRRHITGHAVFLKHASEILVPARSRPEKNHNVAVPRWPERMRLLIRDRIMSDKLPDPEGDCPGLDAPAAVALLLFLLRFSRVPLRAVDHQQLRFRLWTRRIRGIPGLQRGCPVVLHAADLRPADMPENRVDRIQYLGAGAEIAVEINPLVLRIIRTEGPVFFHENLRPREPELVDALLDVPDHEPVSLPPALA